MYCLIYSGSLGGRGGAPTDVWFARADNQPQGSVTSPSTPGQAGGGTGAGAGGGVLTIRSAGAFEHEGWISANGSYHSLCDFLCGDDHYIQPMLLL